MVAKTRAKSDSKGPAIIVESLVTRKQIVAKKQQTLKMGKQTLRVQWQLFQMELNFC